MAKYRVPHRCFFLFFAILGSICGVQRAQADEVPLFSGAWQVDSNSVAFKSDQSIDGLMAQFGSIPGSFSFNASISDYSNDLGCTPPNFIDGCVENWSGTYSGGAVSLIAGDSGAYMFTGAITSGSFSGIEVCDSFMGCNLENRAAFDFTSTWTNGWSSDGSLIVDSVAANRGSKGILSMRTVTPEPSNMILVPSGIIIVAVFLRRRLSMQLHRRTLTMG
jgi:hypothetical protein